MTSEKLRKGRYSESGRFYFITISTYQRQRILTDFYTARLLIKTMRQLHDDHYVSSLAWVVMPDHMHWLFSLGEKESFVRIIKLLKGRSARNMNTYLQRKGFLWQSGFYDHALRHDEDVQNIARYIVANPLRAGIVSSLREYPHWDAAWL